MSSSRAARRFLIAFGLAVAAVAVTAVLRSGASGEASPDLSSPTTTGSSSLPTATDESPVATPRSTAPNSTTTVALTPATVALPRVRLDEACTRLFGPGTELVTGDGPFDLQCRQPDGDEDGIDIASACETEYGSGVRAVLVGSASSAESWRCSARDRVELGSPDWNGYCKDAHGDDSTAFLIADDSQGWRCASLVNGVYGQDDAFIDAACQFTFGVETFGEALPSGSPEDDFCYGASA